MFARLAACAALALTLTAPVAGAATWNTLSGEAPVVIAHRGDPYAFPENGLAGYISAITLGADYVETDVQITSDGVLILMHDETLTRTTDVETVYPGRASYAVADFTAAEIAALHLKTPDGTGLTTETVPTLDDFLDAVNATNAALGTDTGVLIEIKGTTSPETVQKAVAQMIAKGFETPEKGQIQSFDTANVAQMASEEAASAADIFIAQLGLGVAAFTGTDALIATSVSFDASGNVTGILDAAWLSALAGYTDAIAMYWPLLDTGLITLAHFYGLEVYAWTFDDEDVALAASMPVFVEAGLDGFITNQTALASSLITAVPLPGSLPVLAGGLVLVAAMRRRS